MFFASVSRLLDCFCASCARISWIVMMRVSPLASTDMPGMFEAARLVSAWGPGLGERRVGELRPCAMMSERVSVEKEEETIESRPPRSPVLSSAPTVVASVFLAVTSAPQFAQ